jgi:F-type H+-transporting ATPase subunit c
VSGNHLLRQFHMRGETRMRNLTKWLLLGTFLLIAAPAAFAQGSAPAAEAGSWVAISAAFGMAIASGACGYAQSKASAAASESFARNPGAGDRIWLGLLLSLVLIESMALYTFAIVLIKVK